MAYDIPLILGITATAVAFVSYAPYLWQTFQGSIRPHIFSWFLWGILTLIGFAAQVYGEGGMSAATWTLGASGLISFFIAGLALYKGGKRDISKSDWYIFFAVLSAIPLWVITESPFWSVILITVIDAAAFVPTFRKGWQKPFDDALYVFILSALKYVIALFALSNYTVVTVLFPASLVVTNGIMIGILLIRRKMVAMPRAPEMGE